MDDLFQDNARNTGQNVTLGRFRPGDRAHLDFYETPPGAVRALITLDPALTLKPALEPCAGNGAISRVLKEEYGCVVESRDIVEREYPLDGTWNYLTAEPEELDRNVITNPPYEHAVPFILKSLGMVLPGNRVCLLLRTLFLEGQARRRLFDGHPPLTVAVFSKRPHCPRAYGGAKAESGALSFAWFIWQKGHTGDTRLTWV